MSRAADDCGWRQYPPKLPLPLVISVTDPDWYDAADICEAVNAAHQEEINQEFHRAMAGWMRRHQ